MSMSGADLEFWCHETFLRKTVLDEVLELRERLKEECVQLFRLESVNAIKPMKEDKDYDLKIRKALARGFYYHFAIHEDGDVYRTLDNHAVGLSPDSSLVNMGWEYVVYHKMEYSSKQYMDRATVVELDWLLVRFPVVSCMSSTNISC
jgi:hypothetical protein